MDDSVCPVCGAIKTSEETVMNNKYKIITKQYSCGTKKITDTIGGFWHSNLFGPCANKRRR